MSPEAYEELRQCLGEFVVFMRSHACPYHEHITVGIVTHDGVVPWHGPACEVPELQVQCDYREEREDLLQKAYEVLGTKDMSEYT